MRLGAFKGLWGIRVRFALCVLLPLAVAQAADGIRLDSLSANSTRRVYTDVRVKAYDAQSNRVTILCHEGMANLSLDDFPPEIRERIVKGPKLLNAVTASTPNQKPIILPKEKIEEASSNASVLAADSPDSRIEALVRNRARGYFRFNYTARGVYDHVTVEITCQPPIEMAGWAGRYRVNGEATYTLYDQRNHNIGTEVVGFEADVKVEDGKPEIIDFRNE